MQVVFSGTVSAQVAAGETVTITVTKPDGTKDILTATTLADKTYTVTKIYTVAGNYSVSAHINADAQYVASDAGPKAFTINLETRTLTLDVAIT